MLIPLDEVIDVAKLNPEDFYPEGWKAAHWGGRCYGIPAQTTTEMLFYRTDLFEQAGIRPPSTTDELLDAAKALHDPENKGTTGYLAHPSGCGSKGISPVGGYILGIPSNISPERIEAAGRALAHLTSPQAQKLYIQHGSCGTPRYSVVEDAEVQGISPIFEVFDKLSQDDLIQSWPRPAIPELEAIIQACRTSIHDLLRGQITIEEALNRAQDAACEAIKNNRRSNTFT